MCLHGLILNSLAIKYSLSYFGISYFSFTSIAFQVLSFGDLLLFLFCLVCLWEGRDALCFLVMTVADIQRYMRTHQRLVLCYLIKLEELIFSLKIGLS